jgi:prolyl oligopeptidase PreP (S9A serine peptidase family)
MALLVLVSASYPSYSASKLQCEKFYRDFDFPRNWLAHQAALTRDYIKGSSQEKAIEKILLEINQAPRDLIEPLEADGFTIQIIDQGLGPHKPVEVIMTNRATQEKHVLLSSLKLEELNLKDSEKRPVYAPNIKNYRNNNTTIPVWAQLSPKRDFLLVKVSAKGSIDGHTLVIINLATRKIVQEIENVDPADTVWVSGETFLFKNQVVGKVISEASLRPDGTFQIKPNTRGRVSASSDQQWHYRKKTPTTMALVNTLTQKEIILPALSIEELITSKVDNSTLWFHTTGKNGFKELVRLKIDSANPKLETIVPEKNVVIESVSVSKDGIRLETYLGADRWVEFTDFNGRELAKVKAPDCCAIVNATLDSVNQVVEMKLQSPVVRSKTWLFDLKTSQWLREDATQQRIKADPKVDMLTLGSERYVSEFKSFKSKDGTEIPIRLTYKEGTVFDGTANTVMEGYGGFALNNYFHPFYERMTSEWLKSGGVYMAPALRGSYYFGQSWHDQGRALNKQNVIDDFIGAAEWAIANGITIPKKLAIAGASHGGLLVGAAITQRPELFGLAFPQYGPHVFHEKPLFDPITTPLQSNEYGDLISDFAAQALARQLSPYLRATEKEYPFTVVVTGWFDSRVNPRHSHYFAEKLMENQIGDQPIFYYSLNNSGHWMSSIPRQDFIGWRSKVTFWSVLFKYMNMEITPDKP